MTDPFAALKDAEAAPAPDVSAAIKGAENSMPTRRPEFFVAVRKRGLLNAMMSAPEDEFKRRNPGWETRWEYAPGGPNGDTTMVTARESVGFRVVDASEVAEPGKNVSGPIRRGDTILMAAPAEYAQALQEQDARAAAEDLHSPEHAFYDALRKTKVRTRDGEEHHAHPTGNISKVEEIRPAFMTKEGDIKPG